MEVDVAAEALTREEVLRRRSRRLRQLAGHYRRLYWSLMEEVRSKHRDYIWEHGKSPLVADDSPPPPLRLPPPQEAEAANVREETGKLGLGFCEDSGGERRRCGFTGCKAKAMPLTKFCHPHILSDPKQRLYKPCNFVIKSSAQTGQITCGRPVVRAATPSLCHVHLQRSQKTIAQALKKAGVSFPSSSKTVPKLSVLISESVHQIQKKRKETSNAPKNVLPYRPR